MESRLARGLGREAGISERGRQISEEAFHSLQRDYIDATEQFAAMNEVLTALGRSSSDPDAVLDTVVESARRLCRCAAGQIYLIEGEQLVLSSAVGPSSEFVRYVNAHPLQRDRNTLAGRVTLDRNIQQIPDVLSDPEYGRLDVQEIESYRTVISAPLLLDEEVVGALSLWRIEVDPFDDRAISLLQAFATQAAIVVRNVRLVHALEERGAELARKVEQLEALSEVGEVVSSSLVLDEVLSNIIMNAVRFSGCDGGSMMEYVEEERCFSVRSAYASSAELLARLRATRIELETTLVGRAAMEGHPIAVPDLDAVDLDPHLRVLHDDGWRSVLAVPVLRGERIIGALVVRRKTPGDFSRETIEFLETFASQSALAVWNAQLFRELETKGAELEVVSQHKSEFLASMSHELRTPLNAVIGFSEVLLERLFGDLNDRQDEYLRDILSSGRHLLQLLNDILDLSKVEAGRMDLATSTFSIRSALEYGISMVRERAGLHGLQVTLEVEPGLDTLDSDELRFRQVLLNLLSNAVKFTPDGGHIAVTATRLDDDLVVTVTDDGAGIPLEDQERIFESFQQGRRGAERGEGTGLGLTLCRRIVALLGGRMWLESQLGVGSTFGFSVPMRAPAEEPPAGSADDGRLPVVVVVDDDRASLALISAYLDGLGVQVVLARDGREGLELIRAVEPSAIVLDILLPGLDGWEVLARLRQDEATRGIPVIIASIVDEKSRGLRLGVAEYLIKPVGREQLVGALRRAGAVPAGSPAPAEGLTSGRRSGGAV
ncbi:GAF domain-containing protein [Diaminobutyricibacter tongyongensis]|uniref:histidine kinase n=1 Tax=Leifsonia tongyongensis TaxID=1268043 RepID=A0A6L9XSA8_9MICO|nr:ATP-binding protein [Diaminobutyricibacter tongyongensis]NEN04301.1 GAF domain-containing protein [Diaminobutyricibacter tongyongensis]